MLFVFKRILLKCTNVRNKIKGGRLLLKGYIMKVIISLNGKELEIEGTASEVNELLGLMSSTPNEEVGADIMKAKELKREFKCSPRKFATKYGNEMYDSVSAEVANDDRVVGANEDI